MVGCLVVGVQARLREQGHSLRFVAWCQRHAKETVRRLCDIDDPDVATAYLDVLARDMAEPAMPPEVRSLAGTLRRRRAEILAWHRAKVSNGPTEAFNNLIKRIKRVGFGFRRFRNYRVRALLYAGRPNWDLLATITPR